MIHAWTTIMNPAISFAVSLTQLFSAAGIIGTIIYLYQTGDEAIAVLNAEQCYTNHTSLNPSSDALEQFMNIALPITAGLYVLCTGIMKSSGSEILNESKSIAVILRTLVVHFPLIVIIMQTIMVVMSTCPAHEILDEANTPEHADESIKMFGYGFIVLGSFFAISSMSARVKDGDESMAKVNIIILVDAILRCAAFFIGHGVINNEIGTIGSEMNGTVTQYNYTDYDQSCYYTFNSSHPDGFNQTVVDHVSFTQNKDTFETVTMAFGIITILEILFLAAHYLNSYTAECCSGIENMFKEVPVLGTLATRGGVAATINFLFVSASRLTLTLIVGGMVLDRTNLECNPLNVQFDEGSNVATFIILATVSFIPSLLSQQLDWESDVLKEIGWFKHLYSKTGEAMGSGDYMSGLIGN